MIISSLIYIKILHHKTNQYYSTHKSLVLLAKTFLPFVVKTSPLLEGLGVFSYRSAVIGRPLFALLPLFSLICHQTSIIPLPSLTIVSSLWSIPFLPYFPLKGVRGPRSSPNEYTSPYLLPRHSSASCQAIHTRFASYYSCVSVLYSLLKSQ